MARRKAAPKKAAAPRVEKRVQATDAETVARIRETADRVHK